MPATYEVVFDPSLLPAWARRHKEVVELAKSNLAFRCDVMLAESPDYRRFLVHMARCQLRHLADEQ